jgi:1,4-alpha-glucan branching enzyme
MKRKILLFTLLAIQISLFAQKVTVNPTISPPLFSQTDQITVTYDVTGTSLANLSVAYIWVWIPGKNTDAKYNINPATAAADPAKFTKSVAGGKTTFSITFKPSDFFATSIASETQIGMLIKGTDWANGQSTDYLANFGFKINLKSPATHPVFVNTNGTITINAETSVASTFELFVNDVSVNVQPGITAYNYVHTATEVSGASTVRLKATSASGTDEVSFDYVISQTSPAQTRPAGIIDGINYDAADATKATLCLWAPGKTSVYVVGDFTNWKVLPQNIMKKDGERFWIQITGLVPGTEYAFQYLVDESIRIADPYADKILDPDDQYIPSSTYPNLKTFPSAALSNQWYFNRLAVLQTGQTPFAWTVTNFQKPAKEKLVIYELLVRDYFENGERNYQNLIDTLGYLKRLGVNAIELMPVMEFNGNEGWGYNPTFMFAPDKYYGTKNAFKEFIDQCHQNGIAVILDIAMNHHDVPNPYVMIDFDFVNFKPQADNKWFNVNATHPFNVFFDMNHESAYTKKYLDTVNYHWLNEYKVDGFRFDLSKGFTQQNNPSNVNLWSAYDPSRIAILKRMADKIWANFPNAYVILEHLAVNLEEKELAEYRAGEGKGMMLWGNLNYHYNQLTMGYEENSDISGVSYVTRGWSVPHLVGYMESHDEERLMVRNISFGNTSGDYSVKDTLTSLERIRAASTMFYTVPGPKMLWQFGELGYDYGINYCTDGTTNDGCRLSPKPIRWDYKDQGHRAWLYSHVADLNRLRNTYDIFTSGAATITAGASLTKQIILKNVPYTAAPTTPNDMNAVVAANFDVVPKSVVVEFPHTGLWYDYYADGSVNVTASTSIFLEPGEAKIFTDVAIGPPQIITDTEGLHASEISVFPNPAGNYLTIQTGNSTIHHVSAYTIQGKLLPVRNEEGSLWDVSNLPAGIFILQVRTTGNSYKVKVIKR